MSVNSISLWQGPINKTREEYVRKAFQKMDATGDGQITVDDIRKLYDASQHPKFQSGEWTADQCFRHFLDSFDTPGDPDGVVYNLSDVKNLPINQNVYLGFKSSKKLKLVSYFHSLIIKTFWIFKVTWDEFLNYYTGVSASIDDDNYFCTMMKRAWRM